MIIKLADTKARILIDLIKGFSCKYIFECQGCLIEKECDMVVFDVNREIYIHDALKPFAISKFLEYFTEEDLFEILL